MNSRENCNGCGPVVSGPNGESVQLINRKTTIRKNGMLIIKLRNGNERVFGDKEISDYDCYDNVLRVIDTDGSVIGYYPVHSIEYAEWKHVNVEYYNQVEAGKN